MSDTDGKKTLGLRSSRPGQVKQSFSHGRTKNVVVETKRKRVVVPKPGASKPSSGAPAGGDPNKRPAGISDAELERRMKALAAAKANEDGEAKKREADEKARAEERERRRLEIEEKERTEREREEAPKAKAEEDERRKREAEAAKAAPVAEPVATPAQTPGEAPRGGKPAVAPRKPEREREDRRDKGRAARDDSRRSGKLTLNQALTGGEGGRQRSLAAMKRKQERARQKAVGGSVEREKVVRTVRLPEAIMVSELANRMSERVADVVKSLMNSGMMATQNQTIDADTAELVIEEFGHRAQRVSDADVEEVIKLKEDDPKDLQPRPPVITIMGHVDHGKTSLLDAIRKANVTSGEAGGITQHIGAYQVTTDSGATLSFLDTPGHAAFTSMRSRGAQVTDIVVLVVAADDAVMPQTVEAINHAKAAEVPMIVAINKVDKPDANPDKVRTDLLQHEVIVEKMSGEVQDVEVSATTGQGLDELLEAIALQAEILELHANPSRAAQGAVIEAQLDVGRGPVATVLVQNGAAPGRHLRRRRAVGQGPRDGERQGRAYQGSRPFGSRGSARSQRHTRGRRRSERRRHRGAGPRDRRIPRESGEGETRGCGCSHDARADDGQGQGRRERRRNADSRQSRRAGFCGSNPSGDGEDRQRRSPGAGLALWCRRHHRDRYRPGGSLGRAGHRLQCAGQRLGAEHRQPEGRRNPLLQRDLRPCGRHQGGRVRSVVRGGPGKLHRLCEDHGGLQGIRCRQGRGLSRHRGRGAAFGGRAPVARRRGDSRGHTENAQALQGRGRGGAVGPGVRHGVRELRRHSPGRRHRDIRARRGRAQACLKPVDRIKNNKGRPSGRPFSIGLDHPSGCSVVHRIAFENL